MQKMKAFYLVAVLAISVLLLSSGNVLAVSEEAQRHFDRGMAAVEMAKSPDNYTPAIREFELAIKLAPDWPEAYYKLGMVQEKAEKYSDAITSLWQYLRLAPNASDAAAVKSLVNKLEFKAEQTITDEVALEIFGSLGDSSKWQQKGTTVSVNHALYTDHRIESIGRDGQQIVITYLFNNVDKPIHETMRVTPKGKTLAFDYTWFLCWSLANGCPRWSSVSLEIISRSHVRMFVKMVPEPVPGWRFEQSVKNYSYEFVKIE